MTKNVLEAMKEVKREFFLSEELTHQAYLDIPLPIGFGQTNSQPTTVMLMLEWLDPQAGDKILDVGSGSGWSSALLGYMVGPKGKVYATEIIPELLRFGIANCKEAGARNVKMYKAGHDLGLQRFAPYDRILVNAAATDFPDELGDQLKTGGRMVLPIRNNVYVVDKIRKGEYELSEKPGFLFVPLVHKR